MKRAILFVLWIVVCAPLTVHAESFEIERFGFSAQILSNGTVAIKETIAVDFYESRHGIFRTIPYRSVVNGKYYSILLSDFRANRTMKVTKEKDRFNIRLGDADTYVRGNQTYVIEYTARKAIQIGNTNYDEFYWNVTGNEWETPIRSTHIEIELPGDIVISENVDYRLYYGESGSDRLIATSGDQTDDSAGTVYEKDAVSPNSTRAVIGRQGVPYYNRVTVSVEGNKLIFNIPRRLRSNEGFTLQLRMKKGIIVMTKWQAFWYAFVDFIDKNIHYALAAALFLVSVVIWLIWGKDRKAPIMTEFLPPHGISPAEANSILKQKPVFDLPSTLVDLAVRGFIVIGANKKKTYIEKKMTSGKSLKQFEQVLMEELFSFSFIDLSQPDPIKKVYATSLKEQFYPCYLRIVQTFKEFFTKRKFFERSGNVWRGLFIFFAILSLALIGLGCILFKDYIKVIIFGVLAILNNIFFAIVMPKKTNKGLDYYNKILGFKEFISRAEQDRIKQLTEENPRYFDDTIPYAIVFGMAKEWGKKFKGIITKPPDWYLAGSQGGHEFNSSDFVTSISSRLKEIRSSAVSEPTGSGSSGGGDSSGSAGSSDSGSSWSGSSGDWGGSSGGGSGGGGGGSW